ncbi:hypothetical protein GCM10023165_30750 [Variovorax defluvii]|uniref:Uncharacterized protein n=1 Tax=Variovorax defluvii TaxID=913761 RepID=A0ABP8HWR4_9BURK
MLGWLACTCAALAQPSTAAHTIAPAEQAARDNDRVEILRQELRKSEALLETLARRKAERLAASDSSAVTETEEQHARTLADIAGLKRELASAMRTTTPTTAQTPAWGAGKPATERSRAPKASAAPPWWDVYGKGRRADPATPISLAPPSGGIPRPVSAR